MHEVGVEVRLEAGQIGSQESQRWAGLSLRMLVEYRVLHSLAVKVEV